MKAILMSIKPKWCEKIVNGEKTIEVRKTAPKEVPFKVYIYCTNKYPLFISPDGCFTNESMTYQNPYNSADFGFSTQLNGKVIGEFVCNQVELFNIPYPAWWSEEKETINLFEKGSCLFINELYKYANEKPIFGLHISDLKVYDEPRELGEFKGYCNKKEECYKDIVRHCNDTHFDWKCNSITRPPQSWQYVEELKE